MNGLVDQTKCENIFLAYLKLCLWRLLCSPVKSIQNILKVNLVISSGLD